MYIVGLYAPFINNRFSLFGALNSFKMLIFCSRGRLASWATLLVLGHNLVFWHTEYLPFHLYSSDALVFLLVTARAKMSFFIKSPFVACWGGGWGASISDQLGTCLPLGSRTGISKAYDFPEQVKGDVRSRGGLGHLNVTRRGGAHFFRISTTRSGKKLHFDTLFQNYQITKNSKNNRQNNSLLFLKTIAYCS